MYDLTNSLRSTGHVSKDPRRAVAIGSPTVSIIFLFVVNVFEGFSLPNT